MSIGYKLRNNYLPIVFAVILFFNGLVAVISAVLPIIKGLLDPKIAEITERFTVGTGVTLTIGDHINCVLQVIIGYVLMILGKGLYDKQRRTWCLSIIFLVIMIASNIWVGTHFNKVTIIYIAVVLLLIASYKIFNVKSQPGGFSYYQILVFFSLVLAFLYGVVGSYILRDQFIGLKTWVDSVYFTLITYATIGYGNITPATQTARIFVVTMIFAGLGTFATALTVVLLPLIENKMKRMLKIVKGERKMNNHVVLCGYTALTKVLINKLVAQKIPFEIIDNVERDHPVAEKFGYNVIVGNATDSNVLKNTNIREADSIISLYEQDSDNILTGITIKEVLEGQKKPKNIILRIENEDNIAKALSIGATDVISPSLMAAEKIIGKQLVFK